MPRIRVVNARPYQTRLDKRHEIAQMKLSIANMQKAHRVNISALKRLFAQMAQNLCNMTPGTRWSALSLVLTDNSGIRRIKNDYMHIAEVTDVIAFRYDPLPGETGSAWGDIFVNVERAVEYGQLYGGSSRELALYVAHGCDHLAGEVDDSSAGYVRMRRRELRWLKSAASAGLLKKPLLAKSTTKRTGPE